ncbi:MAG: type II CRISPR RNA-guided endonuclease Cas9 [Lachnospiraceae bacterium]|nr:type II CRISPR RNA-guided endonuclease Cas9 [Lachnospiraceae bacterium]
MENLRYSIGLDIGIASVGWAAVLLDEMDRPKHILDMNVRIFTKAEEAKKGESLAKPSRDYRSQRRRNSRKKLRISDIKYLFEQNHLISRKEFEARYYKRGLPDVYYLRTKALDERISDEELAQVLLHIAIHRGFKSNRKSETKEDENGKVLNSIKANEALMEEKQYRTVGEMLYKDEAFISKEPWSVRKIDHHTRNKSGNYQHTVKRSMLEDEVHIIFEKQRSFGNEKLTEEFEKNFLEIMLRQRSYDDGPGKQANGQASPYAIGSFAQMAGDCSLEKGEKRAPKASFTSELFVALQKINHLRLRDQDGVIHSLTDEQRELVLTLLFSNKEIKYVTIRSKLHLPTEYRFVGLNYNIGKKNQSDDVIIKNVEKSKLTGLISTYDYMKTLGWQFEKPTNSQIQVLNRIADILTGYKSDDNRREQFENLSEIKLSSQQIEELLYYNPTKYQHLSYAAMNKIIPFLFEGMTYDKACVAAGYGKEEITGKKKYLKGLDITEQVNDISNPVVRRAVSQSIKVLNNLIRKYGSPVQVHVELARELAKNFKERKNIEADNKKRNTQNENAKKVLTEAGLRNISGFDIVKYNLWEEQKHICMYTGLPITVEELLDSGLDVDHIIPYSKSFDDSYHNKVLVKAKANRDKGNRTPYEYFQDKSPEELEKFEIRVKELTDYRKQLNLLKKHFTEEEAKQFKERNLNDTKYISRFMFNLIRKNLLLVEPKNGKKKQVFAVNGSITSYLRKRWGLPLKDRTTDRHHAVDALVIACCTDGMIHVISRYMQARELRYAKGFQFVDEETGEIFDRSNFTPEQWDSKFGVRFPEPWNSFREEAEIRTGDDPLAFIQSHPDVRRRLDYPEWLLDPEFVHPMFISRMVNHKVTGPVHDATVQSAKHLEEGIKISRVELTTLKLDKNGEIENYYARESDRLLYDALKKQLQLYGGKGKDAFKEPFHKPKSDGTPGPVVRKVKIQEKSTAGVLVNNGKGIANNGSMIRIDVFEDKGKYYIVPIYASDVVCDDLPDKAIVAHKPEDQWRTVQEENFLFSLYPNDLVHIVSKKGIPITINGEKIKKREIYGYYCGFDRAGASMKIEANDRSFSSRSGVQSVDIFEKCNVDVLGKVTVVHSEKRMGFHK